MSHLKKPDPTKIPAMLSRATPVLTMLGSWTTPNNTTVSNSPEEKKKYDYYIELKAINSTSMTLKGRVSECSHSPLLQRKIR